MRRRITQAEFDAIPTVDGIKCCPGYTNYSDIGKFGAYSFFGARSSFGAGSFFGEECYFGARCSFGEHCYFDKECSFDMYCSFSKGCFFNERSSFGKKCYFGERCYFCKGCTVENGKTLLSSTVYIASGFGSQDRTTYGFAVSQEEGWVYIQCGCWAGTIADFRKRVMRVHGDSPIAAEYLAMAALFETRRNRQKYTLS